MAKFYIQSGTVQYLVQAEDAEAAALWALNKIINRCLEQNTPTDLVASELVLTANEQLICRASMALDHFDSVVAVSQIGFGRDESGVFDTEILFKQWSEYVLAMTNLFDQL